MESLLLKDIIFQSRILIYFDWDFYSIVVSDFRIKMTNNGLESLYL